MKPSCIIVLIIWAIIFVHPADAQTLLPSTGKINCVKVYENTLYVGTEDKGLLYLSNVFSDTSKLRPLSVPNLPSKINDLKITKDSLMYVATNQGLFVVKQGQIINSYTVQKGIPSNNILSVEISLDGTLWIGMDIGLGEFYRGSYKFFNKNLGLLGNEVRLLKADLKNRIWIVTEKGVNVFEEQKIKGFELKNITAMDLDQSNTAYIATSGGVQWIANDSMYPVNNQYQTARFIDVYVDATNRIWTTSEDTMVLEITRKNGRPNLTDVTKSHKEIKKTKPRKIVVDITGNKFFVGDFLIVREEKDDHDSSYAYGMRDLALEYERLGRYTESGNIFNQLISTFKTAAHDPDLLIRYAHVLETLNQIDQAVFIYQTILHEPSVATVQDSVRKSEALFRVARIFNARGEASCAEYYQKIIDLYPIPPFVESAYIELAAYCVLSKNESRAIELYGRFIQQFPASKNIWDVKKKLADMFQSTDRKKYELLLEDIFEHSNDMELLYAYRADYELFRLQRLLKKFEKRIPTNFINRTLRTDDTITCSFLENDILWLGTAGKGVIRIVLKSDPLRMTYYTADSGLANNYIRDIFVDSKGAKWFSCGTIDKGKEVGGLSKYDNKKWTTFTSRNGFKTDRVLSAFVTDTKIIVTNAQGIFVSKNGPTPYWVKFSTSPNASVEKAFIDNLEKVWFLAKNKIMSGNENKLEIVPFADSSKTDSLVINNFFMDGVGNKIACTNKGIFKYDTGKFKPFVENTGEKFRSARVFLLDLNGNIYVGGDSGLFKQNEWTRVDYSAADSLPSNKVLGIYPYASEKIILTDHGIAFFKETARDTVKLLQQITKDGEKWMKEGNTLRVRQMYRQWAKNPELADYFNYRLGQTYETEGKLLECLNYFSDYIKAKGKTEYINLYTFFQIGKAFEKQGDIERADAIYLAMTKAFSSSALSPDLNLEDESLAHYRCDLSSEKNPFIIRLPNCYLHRAQEYYAEKKLDLSLQAYRNLSQIFIHGDFSSARKELVSMVDDCYRSRDDASALKVSKYYMKYFKDSTDETFPRILFQSAGAYQAMEQYKEASQMFGEIVKLQSIVKLRPEISLLHQQTKQLAELGLRAGSGYSDLNSTNTMEFEGNFMWLGTSKGVIRWSLSDGSYKKYASKDGLSVDYIYSMLIDSANGKWFAGNSVGADGKTTAGISYFDGEKFTPYSSPQGITGARVRVIAMDMMGRIWAGTDNGVSRFEKGKWIHYDLKKRYDFSYVTDLTFDRNNQLWISLTPLPDYPSSTGGLMKFNEINPTVIMEKNGLSSNFVKSVKIDSSDRLWICTNSGISIWNPKTNEWKYLSTKDGLISETVRDIEFDNGNIWIATDKGLTRIRNASVARSTTAMVDNTSVKSFTEKDGLVTNDIRLVRAHPEFGTWVGSRRGSFSIGNFRSTSEESDQVPAYNKKLFEISKESEALFEKAQRYIEQGDYDKAREIYLDVLDRVANSEWADDAQFLLAKSYELEGKYDEAEKAYSKFVKNNAQSDLMAGAYIGMGTIFEKQKKYDRAEEAFNLAESQTKDKATAQQAKILAEKVKVKKITAERTNTENLAQLISQKYILLGQAKTEDERNSLKAEIAELEIRANKSAKAAGYNLSLYKVKPGESLWYLSEKFLGDAKKWKDFFIANEGKIADPNLILEGQTIVVLLIEKGYKEKMEKFLYYDVTSGDDLETIAAKLYGNKEKWKLIYDSNKEILSASPKKSLPKMKIVIPISD